MKGELFLSLQNDKQQHRELLTLSSSISFSLNYRSGVIPLQLIKLHQRLTREAAVCLQCDTGKMTVLPPWPFIFSLKEH